MIKLGIVDFLSILDPQVLIDLFVKAFFVAVKVPFEMLRNLPWWVKLIFFGIILLTSAGFAYLVWKHRESWRTRYY